MVISLEYLKRDGLLTKHLVIPLRDNDARGLFIGIYDKTFFEDIREFSEMLFRISSITQDWYSYGNLEAAYQWYHDDYSGRLWSWLERAKRYKGTLRDWLTETGVDVDLQRVPPETNGKFYVDGDANEFSLIIKNEQYFIDVFLADRT